VARGVGIGGWSVSGYEIVP